MQVHTLPHAPAPCLLNLPPPDDALHKLRTHLGQLLQLRFTWKIDIFLCHRVARKQQQVCLAACVCVCVIVGRWVVGGPTAAVIMIVCVSKQQQQQHEEQHQLLLCLWFPSVSRRVTVYLFIYLFSFASNRFCLQVDTTRSPSLSCSVSFADNLYTHHAALTSDLH